MALSIHPHAANIPEPGRRVLTPNEAMRQAWYGYVTLLLIPFVLFLGLVTALDYHQAPATSITYKIIWMSVCIAFLILTVPLAFFYRAHLFKPYWEGHGVSPRNYIWGMLAVWMAFEAGGILSLFACYLCNALLPCLLPALAAFVFFLTLAPNGRAMVRPTGNTDDPEIYAEPR